MKSLTNRILAVILMLQIRHFSAAASDEDIRREIDSIEMMLDPEEQALFRAAVENARNQPPHTVVRHAPVTLAFERRDTQPDEEEQPLSPEQIRILRLTGLARGEHGLLDDDAAGDVEYSAGFELAGIPGIDLPEGSTESAIEGWRRAQAEIARAKSKVLGNGSEVQPAPAGENIPTGDGGQRVITPLAGEGAKETDSVFGQQSVPQPAPASQETVSEGSGAPGETKESSPIESAPLPPEPSTEPVGTPADFPVHAAFPPSSPQEVEQSPAGEHEPKAD